MSKIEKKVAIALLVFGSIVAVIGYSKGSPMGMIVLLISALYIAYMYFTSKGDDDGDS
jgi:hypothetical protein